MFDRADIVRDVRLWASDCRVTEGDVGGFDGLPMTEVLLAHGPRIEIEVAYYPTNNK